MRPEPLKLAGIVTVLFGGVSCLSATAMGAELLAVAAGRIVPFPDALPDAAGDRSDVSNLPVASHDATRDATGDAAWHAMVRVASSAPDALNGARDGALSEASAEQYAISARGASAQAVQLSAQAGVTDAPAAQTDVDADAMPQGAQAALNAPVASVDTQAHRADDDVVAAPSADASIDVNSTARSDVTVVTVMPAVPAVPGASAASIRADAVTERVAVAAVAAVAAEPQAGDSNAETANAADGSAPPALDPAAPPIANDATIPTRATGTVEAATADAAVVHEHDRDPAATPGFALHAAGAANEPQPVPATAAALVMVQPSPVVATTAGRPEPRHEAKHEAQHEAQHEVPRTQRLDASALTLNSSVSVDTAPHSAKDDSGGWSDEKLALVSNDKLDSMRGGFETPSGLMVSFGITREAFVNGTMVSSASVTIPDVAHMTTQQAQMLVAVNSAGLIQNGAGNIVQGALPQLGGTTIQNTLSNQQIQALTTINTTVNSLAIFQGLNIANTLNNALTSAIHPR